MNALERTAVKLWTVNNEIAEEFGDSETDWNITSIELKGMRQLLLQEHRFTDAETAAFLSDLAHCRSMMIQMKEHLVH